MRILVAFLLLSAALAAALAPSASANPVCDAVGWTPPLGPPPGWKTSCVAVDNAHAAGTCLAGYNPLYDPPLVAYQCLQKV